MSNTDNAEPLYTEDQSSGMGHIRLVVNGNVMSDERDNLDDAGAYRTIDEATFRAKPRSLRCLRCDPEPDEATA